MIKWYKKKIPFYSRCFSYPDKAIIFWVIILKSEPVYFLTISLMHDQSFWLVLFLITTQHKVPNINPFWFCIFAISAIYNSQEMNSAYGVN